MPVLPSGAQSRTVQLVRADHLSQQQLHGGAKARDVRDDLRQLQRRGARSVPATRRQACVLLGLLRNAARRGPLHPRQLPLTASAIPRRGRPHALRHSRSSARVCRSFAGEVTGTAGPFEPSHGGRQITHTRAAAATILALPKNDAIEMDGTVVDALPNTQFKVRLDNVHELLAYTGGKMRKFRIRILLGDRVRVEMSPYDLTRGRISYRYR